MGGPPQQIVYVNATVYMMAFQVTKSTKQNYQKKKGYTIGHTSGRNCNSLIDSLLQLLIANDIIKRPPADAKEHLWRMAACDVVRQHLCSHSNLSLHPRLRSEDGEAVNVASEVHADAFLEHRKHASAIISFLIEKFGLQNPKYARPFRVIVYSRFDGVYINCEEEGIDVVWSDGECIPPQKLYLYCNTGTTTTGLKYDPMVVNDIECHSTTQTKDKSDGVSKDRKRRRREVVEEFDPHDEKPTFMQISSNRRSGAMSCCSDKDCSE